MKIKRVFFGFAIFSSLPIAVPVFAEKLPDSGTRCATLGKQYIIAGKKYTCVKSGGNFVLSNGVVIAPQTTVAAKSPATSSAPGKTSPAVTTSPTTVVPVTTVMKPAPSTSMAPVTTTSSSSSVLQTTTSTVNSNQKLSVGAVDPVTGGIVIADAGQGKTLSVGKTSGRYVVVVPSSCGYQATWSPTVKSGFSCGGKSDWDVPTLKMYFNYIFPVVDPPGGDFWTKEVGTETDVAGVYSGLMIRNINGWGEKRCSNWFSCSGGADKSNSLTVLPVRAYTP